MDAGAPEPDRTRAAIAEAAWWTIAAMDRQQLAEPLPTWVTFVGL